MHSWTRSLSKVEKINLGRYGLSPVITLRSIVVDWIFLRACIRLWDPEALVFRFGAMMEEMCPLFEEFCAIIGCDPNAPLVKHEVKIGYVRSFETLFQFNRPRARAMIVDDQKAILLPLIDEFSEACPDDPNRMRLRMRALVFCLLAGFLLTQALGTCVFAPWFDKWRIWVVLAALCWQKPSGALTGLLWGFVSPIILQKGSITQVWLKDHLQMVATPTLLPYNPISDAEDLNLASHY
ncbi:hypothetical protein JCGZ_08859 [Jatropha curcas]|uniref:Uncharacterized protein n=1 Tax=Jatropha curcas TaxID=180498 RepID=A0A067KLF0_JATCU|nr:hypothetical protein JCGZ_08859 [Jatropha curcas]